MALSGRWCQFELGRFPANEFDGGLHGVGADAHPVTGESGTVVFWPAGAREDDLPARNNAGAGPGMQIAIPQAVRAIAPEKLLAKLGSTGVTKPNAGDRREDAGTNV